MITIDDLSPQKQKDFKTTLKNNHRSYEWGVAALNTNITLADWEKYGFGLFTKDSFINDVKKTYEELDEHVKVDNAILLLNIREMMSKVVRNNEVLNGWKEENKGE